MSNARISWSLADGVSAAVTLSTVFVIMYCGLSSSGSYLPLDYEHFEDKVLDLCLPLNCCHLIQCLTHWRCSVNVL